MEVCPVSNYPVRPGVCSSRVFSRVFVGSIEEGHVCLIRGRVTGAEG